jgi:hypothetical protein
MLESTLGHLVSAGVLPKTAVQEGTARDVASYLMPAITSITL